MKKWPFAIVTHTDFIIQTVFCSDTHSGYKCFSSAVTNFKTLNLSMHAPCVFVGLHIMFHHGKELQLCLCFFVLTCTTTDTQRTDDGNVHINWNWRTFSIMKKLYPSVFFYCLVSGRGKGVSWSLFFLLCLLLIAELLCRIASKNSRVLSHFAFSSDLSG